MFRHTIFALIAVLAFSFTMPGYTQQQWSEYRPAEGGYRVEFPGKPREIQKDLPTDIGPLRKFEATLDLGKRALTVARTSYPPSSLSVGAEAMLDAVRDGQVGNRKLREERRLTVGGAPARRIAFEARNAGVEYFIVSLSVFRRNTLYQLICIVADQESDPTCSRFFDSFALLS